jgi:hypothetical protein
VPDPSGAALFRAVADGGFGASVEGMDGLHGTQPRDAPPELWARAAGEYQLSVVGLGRPSWDVTTPIHLWFPAVQDVVTARDGGAIHPKKIFHWSLSDEGEMRKVLDLGVDGIIVEREDRLCAVLEEEPYRSFCRRASPSEWDPRRAHGVDQ